MYDHNRRRMWSTVAATVLVFGLVTVAFAWSFQAFFRTWGEHYGLPLAVSASIWCVDLAFTLSVAWDAGRWMTNRASAPPDLRQPFHDPNMWLDYDPADRPHAAAERTLIDMETRQPPARHAYTPMSQRPDPEPPAQSQPPVLPPRVEMWRPPASATAGDHADWN